MFGLDELKQTRYFREVAEDFKEEGKLETVSLLLKLGLSVEKISEELGVDIEFSAADCPVFTLN